MSKHTIGHLSPLQIRSATAYNTAMAGFVTASGTLTGDNFAEEGLDARSVSGPMAVSAWTPVVGNATASTSTDPTWHTLNHNSVDIQTTGATITVAAGEKLEVQAELEIMSDATGRGISADGEFAGIRLMYNHGAGAVVLSDTEVRFYSSASRRPDATLVTFAVIDGPLTINHSSGHYIRVQLQGPATAVVRYCRPKLFGTIYRRAS